MADSGDDDVVLVCPKDAKPGQPLFFRDSGTKCRTVVPPNIRPGARFTVRRSACALGARASHSLAPSHGARCPVHARSTVALASVDTHCAEEHVVCSWQTRSVAPLAALASNCVALQCVCAVQVRSLCASGAFDSNSVAHTNTG